MKYLKFLKKNESLDFLLMKKEGGKIDSVFNNGHVFCFEGAPFVTNAAFDYLVPKTFILNRKGLIIYADCS